MAYAEKRGKGQYPWRVKWSIGGGKEDQESGFRTKADALNYGREKEADIRAGRYHDTKHGSITLADYFQAKWLPAQRLADRTRIRRESEFRTHLQPRWGETPLTGIESFDVQNFEKELRAQRSKGTADKVMELLRFMMDDAVGAGMLRMSPVLPLQRRGSRAPTATRRGVATTAENILAIGERLSPPEALLVLTIAYTGMRWGEAAGIRRSFLHLEPASGGQPASGHYVIDPEIGAVVELSGRRVFGPPKNRRGRTVELPPFLVEQLLAHTETMPEGRDLLFVTPRSGNILERSGFETDRWRPACNGWPAREARPRHPARPAAAPIHPGLTIRDLRHTHKTWLAEDDIQPVARDERLGHATPGMDGVYVHATPAMRRRILAVLQRRWERAQKSISQAPPNS